MFKFNPFGCIFPRIVLPGGLGGNEVKAMVEIFFEMKNRRKKSASSSNDAIARPQGIGSQSVGGFPFSPKHLGTVVGICLFLAALVWLVFGQTLGHEFVNYDDDLYVSENPTVIHGLNPAGVGWAFAHIVASNWHPVTMLSHMLDCQFYGLNAGGHHLTNVLLHLTAVILLFLVLREMTGALWRSAFVAAVFAIHPLRVESVAWVAERKDVLSGVFFMLTLWAYVRYARRPFSSGRYLLLVGLFALGLMSKPMLVTLPFVLLLLDYWPLRRFENPNGSPEIFTVPRRLILEKIPLLVLAAAVCGVALWSQNNVITPNEYLPLHLRLENAAVAYVVYLQQMFYPAKLAALYPLPADSHPLMKCAGAVALLAMISGAVFAWRKKFPFLLVGWLWYLGMLVPVIGLVQVGLQAHADRYTYLPQIGLYLLVIWLLAELFPRHRVWLSGLAIVCVVALAVSAHRQVACWKTSESLWTHTLAVTRQNSTAHNNLGNALFQKGQVDDAIEQYQKTLALQPNHAQAHYNLGNALAQQSKLDEAISEFQKALALQPDQAEVLNNLGAALLRNGQVDEAIVQLQKILALQPDLAGAHNNLGAALFKKGKTDEAIGHFQKALALQPDSVDAQNNLARIAWPLATSPNPALRNGTKAVELARQANQASGNENPMILRMLAAACAEAEQFSEAVATAQKALQSASAQNNGALAASLQKELEAYKAGSPFRDAGPTP
jgi:tetratricopeptide (TPR) repeat protein